MAIADPPTTITVRQSTRRLLESVKASGQTYDDLLIDLVDESYSPHLLAELRRRRSSKRRTIPAAEVYRQWGL